MKLDDMNNWMKHAAKDIDHALRNFEGDDILKMLGVEKRRTTFGKAAPVIAFFGVGLAVGAGLAWFLAPAPAKKAITSKAKEVIEDVGAKAEKAAAKVEKAATNGTRTHA